MKIDCIADLHGHYPTLEGGDLLIVAGDLTAHDEPEQYIEFRDWLSQLNYKKIVIIAGNHDNELELDYTFGATSFLEIADYLCDSATEFEGLKIWGSPWTKKFYGMNPKCMAFTCDTDEELAEKWELIPDDTDILITHGPSFGNLDNVDMQLSVGSISLWLRCLSILPRLHIFGHIHESYGKNEHPSGIHLVNCSYVNEYYEPVNKPITIEI